tara:strand:+ start:373 stop:1173 length:801 start_codon:yes stop_codon:yes gene_type:complete
MKFLTEEHIKKYQNDGFLLLKNLLSKEEMEPINESIKKFSRMTPNNWELGKEMAYYETDTKNENERILCRIEKYVDYHEEFKKLVNSEKILNPLEDLMGGPCILFKDKINFKRPNGGGFRPHQDVQARWDDFVEYTMSVMISTDQSTAENGCLEVVPGCHKRGLIGKYDRPLEGEDLKGIKFEMVPTEIGDVLFFDHFTPHQSKPNNSNKPRSNIYLTYNLASDGDFRSKYLDRKRRELPPDNERKNGMKFKNSALHEAKYRDERI